MFLKYTVEELCTQIVIVAGEIRQQDTIFRLMITIMYAMQRQRTLLFSAHNNVSSLLFAVYCIFFIIMYFLTANLAFR